MANARAEAVLRYLRQAVRAARDEAGSDEQLLRRFAARRDEDAFAALVERHGPMVWGACRRLLPQAADADDAFQATFLVLARKAGAIRRPERLANWLYGVACRTAAKARVAEAKRRAHEKPLADEPAGEPVDEVLWRDVRSILDDEVQRLPDRYRTAFVLCYLEGLTNKQAARQLGCPEGTVMSRLAWARERLRHRLARRGLALSASAVTAALLQDAARATVAASLAHKTIRAALAFIAGRAAAAGVSAKAITSAQGVLQAMFLTKLKVLALLTVMIGAAATGARILAQPKPAAEAEPPPQAQAEPPKEKAKAGAEPEAVAVQTIHPQFRENLPVDTKQMATVEAYYRADLAASVAGTVKAVHVTLGASVKKGDVLIEIDAPDVAQEVGKKESAVSEKQNDLRLGQAQVKSAQIAVARAKIDIQRKQSLIKAATATVKYRQERSKRFKELQKVNGVDQNIVDENEQAALAAEAEFNAAKAAAKDGNLNVEETQSALERAEADVELKQALLDVARKDLKRARGLADAAIIKAPFDGVISRRAVDPGTFVQPSRGEPLLTVSRVDIVTVVAKVPNNDARYVEPGMEVVIHIDDQQQMQIRAKISRVAPVISITDRTLRLEVDLWNATANAYKEFLERENKKPAQERFADLKQRRPPPLPNITGKERFIDGRLLLPGMAGRMTLALNKFHNVYLMPYDAVVVREGRPCIFVVEHGRARAVFVRLDLKHGKRLWITRAKDNAIGDFTGKETVILSPPKELCDGQPVKATPVKEGSP